MRVSQTHMGAVAVAAAAGFCSAAAGSRLDVADDTAVTVNWSSGGWLGARGAVRRFGEISWRISIRLTSAGTPGTSHARTDATPGTR
jgi:hypothetical protein